MYNEAINKRKDIIICGYNKINLNGKISEVILPKSKNDSNIDFSSTYFNPVWNKIYKMELIKKYQIEFLKKCHMGEDIVFNVRAFKNTTKISIIQEAYYNYFVNEGSVTQNPNKKIEIYSAINEIKKIGLDFKKLDECIRYQGIIQTFGTIEYVKEINGDWEKYYKEFLKEIEFFKNNISLKTKIVLFYRKIRLRFVFLKKIKRLYRYLLS